MKELDKLAKTIVNRPIKVAQDPVYIPLSEWEIARQELTELIGTPFADMEKYKTTHFIFKGVAICIKGNE